MKSDTKETVDITSLVYEWLAKKLPDFADPRAELIFPVGSEPFVLTMALASEHPDSAKKLDNTDWHELINLVAIRLACGPPRSRVGRRCSVYDILWHREEAFVAPFLGDAHKRLFSYVHTCWAHYTKASEHYRYPYIAMVQSSGFGKSRLLREYALLSQAVNRDQAVSDRVHLLYVCARDDRSSPLGYPVATTTLRDHLFTECNDDRMTSSEMISQLTAKLIAIYDFVMQSPALEVDEVLFKLFYGDREAQDLFRKPPAGSRLNRKRSSASRILVVAVDVASALLPSDPEANNMGWFRCFRRALCNANHTLRKSYGDQSGLFGIVVDTDTKILSGESEIAAPPKRDPSMRLLRIAFLPPFVLTETVDVVFNTGTTWSSAQQVHRCKTLVVTAVAEAMNRLTGNSSTLLS